VTRIGELKATLAATTNRPILVTLMKEAQNSSETSVVTRATRLIIPEDTALFCTYISYLKCDRIQMQFSEVSTRIEGNKWTGAFHTRRETEMLFRFLLTPYSLVGTCNSVQNCTTALGSLL
jgi:hypothetical protein